MPSLSTNQNYLVTVVKGASSQVGHDPGANSVTSNAMAKLNLEIQNHWVNILEALGLAGSDSSGLTGIAGQFFGAAQIFSGHNFLPSIFTSHVWRGSTGIQLSLQMRFDAWDDAEKDVLLPVQKLIAMFCPVRGGSADATLESIVKGVKGLEDYAGSFVLHPPGPTPWEYLRGDNSNMFAVSLGEVMYIDQLVPTTIQWEFEDRFDASGNPMAAMMTLGFISYVVPDAVALLKYFNKKLQTTAIGNAGGSSTPVAPTSPATPAPIPGAEYGGS